MIDAMPTLIHGRMSTCNRLDLQTLGSQPIMSKNLLDHWASRCSLAVGGVPLDRETSSLSEINRYKKELFFVVLTIISLNVMYRNFVYIKDRNTYQGEHSPTSEWRFKVHFSCHGAARWRMACHVGRLVSSAHQAATCFLVLSKSCCRARLK